MSLSFSALDGLFFYELDTKICRNDILMFHKSLTHVLCRICGCISSKLRFISHSYYLCSQTTRDTVSSPVREIQPAGAVRSRFREPRVLRPRGLSFFPLLLSNAYLRHTSNLFLKLMQFPRLGKSSILRRSVSEKLVHTWDLPSKIFSPSFIHAYSR
jgi:hypothetical protein